MSKTTVNAAVVLDAAYIQARNAAVATGGAFSAAACKAATVAFNRAIINHSIFEFQDLETTIKTMPSATRQGLRRAVTACFALAFGEESADRRGSTVFTVKECDCNAARLSEASRAQWQQRADLLHHLDSFKVKVERAPKEKEDPKPATVEELLEGAIAAFNTYITAGGSAEEFAKAAGLKLAKASKAAKTSKAA